MARIADSGYNCVNPLNLPLLVFLSVRITPVEISGLCLNPHSDYFKPKAIVDRFERLRQCTLKQIVAIFLVWLSCNDSLD